MALVNLGAGLSELGKGVAQTAQAWTLEAQKADAQKDLATLADQLASARESTGRREAHGYAMEQQGARLQAEAPEREARTASLTSSTAIASDKAAREKAAGESVSAAISGGASGVPSASTVPTVPTDVMMRLPQIKAAAEQHGVPLPLAVGMFSQENGGKATGVSSAGASGIAQLMPGTAQELGVTNPNDPQQAIPGGVNYLGKMLRKYNGDTTLALMGYNWGPGNVDGWLKSGADPAKIPAETKSYLQRVQGYSQAFGGSPQTGGTAAAPDAADAAYAALAKVDPKAAIELRQKERDKNTPAEARTAAWYAQATPDEQAAFRATAPAYIYAKSREDVAQTNAEAKKQVAQTQRDFKAGLVPSGDALDAFAYAYNVDRSMPTLGFGGAMGKIAIAERAAQLRKEQGISDADWMSGAAQAKSSGLALSAVQKQQAAVEAFSATAEKNGDLVKDLLAKGVGPSGVPIIDKWIQNGRRLTGDDDVGKFGAALYNYLTESAKVTSGAMGNTPLSDSARKEVQDFINKADNEKTILGVIDTMALERQNRMSGFAETIDRLRKQTSGNPGAVTQTAPGATFTNPNPAPANAPPATGAPAAAPPPAAPLSLPMKDGKVDAGSMRGGAVYNTDQGLLRYDAATKRLMPIEAR